MKVQDRIEKILAQDKIENATFPKSVKLEITTKCNYKCSYCYNKDKKTEKGTISQEFFNKILDQLNLLGVEELGLFGLGESTLDKNLCDYIKKAKEKIPYVFLTTNGSLCSKSLLEKMNSAGLDSIKFSINSYNAEDYLKETGFDNFEKVLGSVQDAYSVEGKKWHVSVSSIFYENKKEEALKLKERVSSFVDEFYFLPLYNQAGFIKSESVNSGNIGTLDKKSNPMPCWKLFNFANITWDGYLTACCFDFEEKFKIADLNRVSLIDAWNSEKMKDLRRKHLSGIVPDLCKNCL